MWDWIVKYWVEFLFGLVIFIMGIAAKQIWIAYKHEKERDKEQDVNKCYEKVRQDIKELETKMLEKDQALEKKIEETQKDIYHTDQSLKEWIESMQKRMTNFEGNVLIIEGAYFCERCQNLLDREEIITSDEFADLTADHEAYNRAGGNHTGDALFRLVEQKFNAQHAK